MIEPIMYFGIGFLVAALIGLVVIPLVHGRAVRLTMRRLEAATPLSMAEIQADKDQLRAEFAMSTRRLEMSVEQLKTRSTSQFAELGKKSDAINRLKIELGEKTATIFALEARDKALRDQLRATEEEVAVKTAAMHDAERTLSDKQAELAKMIDELDERSSFADAQKVEIVALKAQIEALKERLTAAGNEVKAVEDRREAERVELQAATKELDDERGKVENLGRRVSELEQQLAAQTAEAEILGRRAQDLENRLTEQSRLLTETEVELKHRIAAIEAAQDRRRLARGHRRAGRAQQFDRRTAQERKGAVAGRARPHQGRARPALARSRRHEARDRGSLGFRAGGERAAARAHQRRRRRSGAAGFDAGRPEFADRRHSRRRDARATAAPSRPPPTAPRPRRRRGERQSRRPHPRAADPRLARADEDEPKTRN